MDLCKFLFFSLLLVLVAGQEQKPIVRIHHGLLQGAWKESTNGRRYASFQGIRYARPPIGKYRFREPQHLKSWDGTWDASKPMPACIQYDPFNNTVTGSEDCLFLNVHTPDLNPGSLLPVLVFIHGGAFMYGAGSYYGAEHLMDRDMVLVTLNYRLGPLGFLSTGDEAAPGNAGLKDQAFALMWVRKNILKFGGNPDSVTLAGCSAGGASVHYHYLSPMSKGLFDRGIAFSGSALASWTHAVKPAQKAKTLASIVGCPTSNNHNMIDCLRFRPAEAIVNAQIEMFDWRVNLFTMFTPTAEPRGTKEPFLTQYPYHAMEVGAMQQLPLIATVTSEEGLYPAAAYQTDPSLLMELESRWEHLASNIFEYNDTLPLDKRSEVAQKIKQYYMDGKPIGQETYSKLVQALGDRLFAVSVGKMAQFHARSGQPTLMYRFSHRGTHSLSELMAFKEENYGVSHADDVLSVFNFLPFTDFSAEDIEMRNTIIDLIYSYAKTGIPQLPNSQEWTKVQPGSKDLNYLEIESPSSMKMKSCSDFGHKTFWDSLGFIEDQNFNINIRDEL
ncbi:venom carboxylesterase-6-like [Danaus plexippus]|uniref:venom carboxylesterase-6-like n=1 Tax=Danaus plexippus TaxID=13037 RepID=UPI002AAF5F06|nr:venom carboxylesterase-6-like [Danaus plexippus]